MRFETELDALTAAAGWAASVTPAKPLPPIIGGIQITAVDGWLTLAAFDYRVSARMSIRAAVETAGVAVVPGRFFAAVINSLPAGQAVFAELDNGQLHVKCGKARFTFPALPAGDFPTIPDMPPAIGTAVAEEFTEAVKAAARAATNDDTLPALTGIRVEVEPGALKFAATDRYRVVITYCPVVRTDETAQIAPFTVPAAAAAAFTKAAAGEGKITFCVSEGGNVIGMSDGTREMTVRGIAEDFPAYGRFFDGRAKCAAVVNAERLLEAAKRCALAADAKAPISLEFGGGEIKVSASKGDGSAGFETIDGVDYDGEDGFSIRFAPGYLIDGLAVAHSRTVRLGMGGKTTPVTIFPVADDTPADADAPEDAPYRYCVVPMRTA